eukprot:scaffold10476_cov142-Cylindrotheca_fusiformis.AAC.3
MDDWSLCCSCNSDMSFLSDDDFNEGWGWGQAAKERDALKEELRKARREIETLRAQKDELKDILCGTQTSLQRVYEGSQGGSPDTSTGNYFLKQRNFKQGATSEATRPRCLFDHALGWLDDGDTGMPLALSN